MKKRQVYSRLLLAKGIRHGFSTRHLGDVSKSFMAWEQACGLPASMLVAPRQVHGCNVLKVDRSASELGPQEELCFDASMTDRKDVVLGIRTADCVPILMCSIDRITVAAVHAGWRGTLAGVILKTVENMRVAYGCKSQDLLAVMGPSIRSCCYQVSRELHQQFQRRFGPVSVSSKRGGWQVDLVEANRALMIESGLRLANIELVDYCSCCRQDLFFSYRGEGERAGRQLGYIALG